MAARRRGAALPARPPRGGAHDRGRVPLLRRIQLRLLPALRRRLHGPALPDHHAALPGRSRWRSPSSAAGTDVALAGVSVAATVIATITHPLVGYETETVVWGGICAKASSSRRWPAPTVPVAAGWDLAFFLLAAAGGLLLAASKATPRMRLSPSTLGWGVAGARSPGHCSPRSRRPCSGSMPASRASPGRRSHRLQHHAALLHQISAQGARSDRRSRRAHHLGWSTIVARPARAPAPARLRAGALLKRREHRERRPRPSCRSCEQPPPTGAACSRWSGLVRVRAVERERIARIGFLAHRRV